MSTKLEACIFSITLNLTIKFGLNQQSDDPTWHLLGPLSYPIIIKLEIFHANSVRFLLFFFKKSDKKIRSLSSVRLEWKDDKFIKIIYIQGMNKNTGFLFHLIWSNLKDKKKVLINFFPICKNDEVRLGKENGETLTKFSPYHKNISLE